MGYLIDDGVDELEIPGWPGEKVVMRRQATFTDDLSVGLAIQGLEEGVERTTRYAVARTLAMIESWTLKGRGGEPLPIDAAAFGPRGLRREVAAWLSNEAARRWQGRSAEDELPFDSRSNQQSGADPASTQTSSPSTPSTTSAPATVGPLATSDGSRAD